LSLGLADHIKGLEVVSADSRQVFRHMDIGTAKATIAERAAVPHHCLDLVDPDEAFTAADYRRAALEALGGIAERGGIACLVGGTGLYLRAIARGLPLDEGSADADIRADLEARLDTEGLDILADELRSGDPVAAARTDLHNPRRVVRALERFALTGTGLPPAPAGYPASVAWLWLQRSPDDHARAISMRVVEQFDVGLIDEADRLRARYDTDLPAFTALGYREAFDVLEGRADVATAIAAVTTRTKAYARRQRTWFRSEPDLVPIAAGAGDTAAAMAALAPFVGTLERSEYAGRS
jgi:tRNA dimethylallyltransferase